MPPPPPFVNPGSTTDCIEGASVVRDGLGEPARVKEALGSHEKDEWEKAMEMEIQSL